MLENKTEQSLTPVGREQLLESFKSLQSQFNSNLLQAKKQEDFFEELRQGFMENLANHLENARANIPDNNPLKQQVLGFIDMMEKTRIEWDTKVAGREKGVQFRSNFEDSLLVFVNGKVKSGKSSLGNYMAWGHTDPDNSLKKQVASSLTPQYFSHEHNTVDGGDAENEAQQKREFRVGATEATSSIQGFKLPGLTWVDSPGLHSVRVENEKLARDYVDHADLILYTMKSDSPGRESDLAEIRELLVKDKTVLLLLTGSDDVEEDFDDETDSIIQKVIMKDKIRCEKQQAYVREALSQVCDAKQISQINIVSFSARYAQLNTHNPTAFLESGMGLLCEKLLRITQSEGVQIKQRTPIANMRNFMQNCLTDLNPYRDLLTGFQSPLKASKKESYKKLLIYIREGQKQLLSYIDEFFSQLSTMRDSPSTVNQKLHNFQKDLHKKSEELIAEQLAKIFEDLISEFKNAVSSAYNNSELMKLPDFHLEKIEENIPIVRGGTQKRNSILGSLTGGALGFLVGGFAGAAIGAGLGAGVGRATSEGSSIDYRTETFTVGDNLQEIRNQAIQTSEKTFEQQITEATNSLWSNVENQLAQILSQLTAELDVFENQLTAMLETKQLEQ